MISTLAPSAAQNARSRSTASGSVPSGGVRMHQRLTKSSAKPESGPESSVPATGCAGMRLTPAGTCGARSRSTAPLTEPTSDRMAPGLRWEPISRATAPNAPIGTQRITRSAPATAAAAVSTTLSTMPNCSMRCRVGSARDVATMVSTTPRERAARAIDEPIRPTPISAKRLKSGAGLVTASRRLGQKFPQRGHDKPVRLLGADGHAQRIRQLIGRRLPQNEPSCREKGVRILGGSAFGLGKMNQHEIGDARRHFEAELADFLRQPVEPTRVVLARPFLVLKVL